MKNTSILQKSQQGFTLIELIIVIVILGVLAVVALPKFVDLKSDARTAAIAGVAGAIASGSVTNYTAKLTGKPFALVHSTSVCHAGTIGPLLIGGLPAGYTVSGSGECQTLTTESVTCTVSDGASPTITADATVLCARP